MAGTLRVNIHSQTCLLWDPQVYPPFPKCWLWIFNCIVSRISIQNTICSQFWVGTWLLSCLLVKDGSKTGLNAVHGTHMKDKNLQLKRLLKCFFHQMLTASLPFPRSPLFMALSAVRLWVLKCGWLVRNKLNHVRAVCKHLVFKSCALLSGPLAAELFLFSWIKVDLPIQEHLIFVVSSSIVWSFSQNHSWIFLVEKPSIFSHASVTVDFRAAYTL